MASWQVQDAKARFSELLDAAINKGPQVVTRRGVKTAVLIPIEEWDDETKALLGGNPVINIFATLAHHPKLMKRWLVFGNHVLAKSTLPARDRELLRHLRVPELGGARRLEGVAQGLRLRVVLHERHDRSADSPDVV